MPSEAPFVIETVDDVAADDLFNSGRDQVVIAIRITPVFGQLDLGVVAAVVDEANVRGFTLVRERSFRDEWLICVFDAFDDAD